MKDLLDRLSKAIGAMTNPNPDQVPDDAEPVEMSTEDFVGYVADQVEKAAADTPEIRVERLKHLADQIEVAKNFEGPTPGKIAIRQFKDPAQNTHTTKTVAAPQNATAGSNATAGPVTQPAGSPSTPSGGQLPPVTAGGSGFSTPAAATFAKAMEDLQKSIAELSKDQAGNGDPPAGDPPPPADAPPTKTKDGEQPVQKAAQDPLWPMDMNTPFGRGETKDDEAPDWGFDPNTDAATRHQAEKPKAAE